MAKLRARIDGGFERFGAWVYRNRFKTLSVMLLVIAAFLSQLPKLGFDTSNESYFHEDDPTILDYDRFREQFGREEFMIVAITPPEVFDRAFLEKLAAFHDALEDEVPYLDDVTSLINVRSTRGEGDELIVEDLLEEMPRTPEEMAQFRERVLAHPLYRNFLVSESGHMTTVVIETLAYSPGDEEDDLLEGFDEEAAPEPALEGQKREPLTVEENRELVQATRAVAARFDGPDFPVHIAGGPPIQEFFERMMQQDMGTFLGLAVLSIAVFLFVLFRRITGVILPLIVVILALLSTVGLMGATGVLFTIPTTILPSFILAVGVGASVHLLSVFYRRYQDSGDKSAAIVYALGHSGLPIFMTSLTTAAGLFAFATAEMAPVAHLGIFAGTGVMIALVYTLVLMPALLAILPLRQRPLIGGAGATAIFDRILTGIADFATRRAVAVVAVSTVVLIVSVVGLFWLKFSMFFIMWLPTTVDIRQATDLIDREMKGTINLEVVLDTRRENGLYEPEMMNGLVQLAAFAEDYRDEAGQPLVAKTNSVADVLKETHRALNENRDEFYTVPQDRRLIAQELLLFENSGSDDLEQVVDSQFSKARLTLIIPNREMVDNITFVDSIERAAERIFGDSVNVVVTGTVNLFTQMVFVMMRSMATSYLFAGIVITLLMMILVGSLRLGLITMIVNFMPILITLGLVMGYSGIRLDAFTLTIGSIALGLAVDDTIHFFHNFRRYYGERPDVQYAVRQTLVTSGRAMLFTTLVLMTGFWLFMFATMNNVFDFGLLTGLTIFFALLADFFLAPAILELLGRTRYGRSLFQRWSGAEA